VTHSRVQFTATTIAALTALAVAAPVLSIILLALQPVPDLWPHLVAYVLPQALRDTALLLLGVGIVTLGVGAGCAWLVSSHDFAGRGLLIRLLPMPLAIPTYLAAYVYVDLFEPLGVVHHALSSVMPLRDAIGWLPNLRSLPGAMFVIGLVLYPYVYLSARAMFQHRSADFAEAARVLGAGRWTIFRRVSLPMARPALAIGLALVSLETLNDIGASEYLGVRTLTVSVFTTWLNRGSLPGAAQLSLLMLAIVAVLIAMERVGRFGVSVEFSAENPRLASRTPLDGVKAGLAFAACAIPALLGFAVPLLYLLRETIRRGLWSDAGSVWRDAGQ
jgi:iron(III) transport system permease protein